MYFFIHGSNCASDRLDHFFRKFFFLNPIRKLAKNDTFCRAWFPLSFLISFSLHGVPSAEAGEIILFCKIPDYYFYYYYYYYYYYYHYCYCCIYIILIMKESCKINKMELRPFILSLFWTFFATIAVVAGISTILAPRHVRKCLLIW